MPLAIDPSKVRLIRTFANDKAGFWSGAVDPAGKRLYVGGTDSQIHVFDLPDVKPAKTEPLKGHQSYVTALAYLSPLHVLVSGGFDKQLIWWKPASQTKPIRQVQAGGYVNQIAVSPDGKTFATATDDLVARLWDGDSGKQLKEWKAGHPERTTPMARKNTLYSIAFSPDGRQIATGDRAGTICFWDVASGKLIQRSPARGFYTYATLQGGSEYEWGGVRSLAFSPDGKLLIAGGMGPADQNSAGVDGPMRLEVFDANTGKSLAEFLTSGFKGLLTSLRFYPNSPWLIGGGGGGQAGVAGVGSICFWNSSQRDKSQKMVPPTMLKSAVVVRELLFSPDGTNLLIVGMQTAISAGRIEVWD